MLVLYILGVMLARCVGGLHEFRWGQHAVVRRSDAVGSIFFPIGSLLPSA